MVRRVKVDAVVSVKWYGYTYIIYRLALYIIRIKMNDCEVMFVCDLHDCIIKKIFRVFRIL